MRKSHIACQAVTICRASGGGCGHRLISDEVSQRTCSETCIQDRWLACCHLKHSWASLSWNISSVESFRLVKNHGGMRALGQSWRRSNGADRES